MKWFHFFGENAGVYTVALFGQALSGPESVVLGELLKQGILVLILGVIIWYQNRDFARREAELKTENKELQDKVEQLYELQSREYRANVNILATNADLLKKVDTALNQLTIKPGQTLNDISHRQGDVIEMLRQLLENRPR